MPGWRQHASGRIHGFDQSLAFQGEPSRFVAKSRSVACQDQVLPEMEVIAMGMGNSPDQRAPLFQGGPRKFLEAGKFLEEGESSQLQAIQIERVLAG